MIQNNNSNFQIFLAFTECYVFDTICSQYERQIMQCLQSDVCGIILLSLWESRLRKPLLSKTKTNVC